MNTQEPKTQIIMYGCCGVVFAACMEPYCYTEKTWLKDLRKSVNRGHEVKMIESAELKQLKMGKCECKSKSKQIATSEALAIIKNQLTLFENGK